MSDLYDTMIQDVVSVEFPDLLEHFTPIGWYWIKAQVKQESSFNPKAISPCNAKGLMQLMPANSKLMGVKDPFDPLQNLQGGVKYLAIQYAHFQEIPTYFDRLRFALASYNGGRGYVNRCLELARVAEKLPETYNEWRRKGSPQGWWQMWEFAHPFLSKVIYKGKDPDDKQMIDYVDKIERNWQKYLELLVK